MFIHPTGGGEGNLQRLRIKRNNYAIELKFKQVIEIIFLLLVMISSSTFFIIHLNEAYSNENVKEVMTLVNPEKVKQTYNISPEFQETNIEEKNDSFHLNKTVNLLSSSISDKGSTKNNISEGKYKPDQTNKLSSTTFISYWCTMSISPGSSNSNQIKLPLVPTGIYNFIIDWGDGFSNTITSYNQPEVTHTYQISGWPYFTLRISGVIDGWSFNDNGDKFKILEISQWGPLKLGNSGSYFYGCVNLVISAIDAPDLTGTTSLSYAFADCDNIGSSGSMNNWDVSNITDMEFMFFQADIFNKVINNWNVSRVTNMTFMFAFSNFNQIIGGWDVSRVNDMSGMFKMTPFNQSIESWNVSQVTSMEEMFSADQSFNQPIGSWDVSKVTNMDMMFDGAHSFNQPLGTWNVSQVKKMNMMFKSLSSTNYDKLLIGWSKLSLQQNVNFNAGESRYSLSGEAARQYIINMFGWIILDHGLITIPFAPRSLKVIFENTYIYLTWYSPSDNGGSPIIYYNIYRSIITSSDYVLLSSVSYLYLDFKDVSVSRNQTYYYIVKAMNIVGESDESNEVKIIVPATFPSAPQFLEAILGNGYVNLSWLAPLTDGGSLISNYIIYRSIISGSGYLEIYTVTSTAFKYVDKSGINGKTYYYIVKALNSIGESEGSNEVKIIIPATFPLSPQFLDLTTENNNITLTWSPPDFDGGSPIISYTIYRSITKESGYSILDTVSNTTLIYMDTSVVNGQTYYYIVKASNSIGLSQPSNEAIIHIFYIPEIITSTTTTTTTNVITITEPDTTTDTEVVTSTGTTITTITSQIVETLTKTTEGFGIVIMVISLFGVLVIRKKRS